MAADLQDQLILITGGARGIGEAAAMSLAERGAHVALADLLDATAAADSINAAGGSASAHTLDVRDKQACQNLADTLVSQHGGIDALVCNAGVCPAGEPFGDDAQWQSVMDVNLNGTRNSIAAVWNTMAERQTGSIVLISSMAFYQGGVIVGTEYTASKAAMIGMTRHLARNGGPLGIRCNAVAPGIIETVMTEGFSKPDIETIPLRRLGQATDVAGPISFLCGPESAYMTGTVLNVTGGMVLAD